MGVEQQETRAFQLLFHSANPISLHGCKGTDEKQVNPILIPKLSMCEQAITNLLNSAEKAAPSADWQEGMCM